MIGIDTFSWLKIIRLYQSEWQDFVKFFIKKCDLFISVEGKNEFEHRFPDFLYLLNDITILPILDQSYQKYVEKGFDSNDASLLEYAEKKNHRIVTEDRPMLIEGITERRNIIQLIDFFYELYINYSFITEKDFKKLVKIFRKWRNITKKKENYYNKQNN